uniref:Membrane protein, palmitoylated 4a (MAGUK p55 subfamily member 4) n=1 Tax=Oreochromis aureus TaxID=47969 RepID=A0AAZ1XXQ0_OREAU
MLQIEPSSTTDQVHLPRIHIICFSLFKITHMCSGVSEVLSSVVKDVDQAVSRNINGAQLLHELLSAPWLCALLKVHDSKVMTAILKAQNPSAPARELCSLLSSPHIQALLSSHDSVAQSDYEPVLPPLPDEIPEDEEAMRIVCLVKNNQPLGATIRKDEATGDIYIARVIHGGLADRSALLHPGDLLVEVNGNPVVGLEPEQVIHILANSQGTILFKVIPNPSQASNSQTLVCMRAMVDYCPLQDSSIPCPDAGMAFSRGDLLQVVDQSDGQWWQARKLPCATSCAGLIPSASMLKSKQREQWWCQRSVCEKSGFRRSFRVWKRTSYRKRRQSCTTCSPNTNALSTPYEEVVLYQRPPQENHRLIILVGASGVGVNELRKRLIKLNPSTFQGPVPHTTRSIRAGEQNGREYHFVTKELFEYMVCNHRFVEYGESKGQLYGISTDAIDEVLKRGRMCIIDAEPHSIQLLRTKKFKPYVIFIKPPSPDRLRQTRRDARIITNYAINRVFSKERERERETKQKNESKYKQFFDSVLVNDDLQDACIELCSIIQQAQDEPQWIPVSWGRAED